MSPATVPNVEVYAGDSVSFGTYRFLEDGVALNLSGYTFEASWRSEPSDATAVVLAVDSSGAASGVIVVSATAAQSRAMGRSGVWDLQGTAGAEVRTFVFGRTSWVEDVTRG